MAGKPKTRKLLLDELNARRAEKGEPPLESIPFTSGGNFFERDADGHHILPAQAGDSLPKEPARFPPPPPPPEETPPGSKDLADDTEMASVFLETGLGEGGIVPFRRGEDDPGEWLDDVFPALPQNLRSSAARFLGEYGRLCDEEPAQEDSEALPVVSRALRYARIPWPRFTGMKKRDSNFSAALEAAEAARREYVMSALESRLQSRACCGQEESIIVRSQPVETRKFDNTLSFNMLKSGHRAFAKKGPEKDDDMTLVVAGGRRAPGAVEGKGPK